MFWIICVCLSLTIVTIKKIKSFFETEYYPQTRKAIGVSQTPNGAAFYKDRIAYYTTLDMTAEEVHQLGLNEVAKIKNAIGKNLPLSTNEGLLKTFQSFIK